MNYYAIGKPNKEFRIVGGTDISFAELNKQYGEVIVPVERGGLRGKISYDGKSVVISTIDMEDELWKVRELRTSLLAQCDYTIFPDSPFTAEERQAWVAYRQALRDITEDQPNCLFDNIVWPMPPHEL